MNFWRKAGRPIVLPAWFDTHPNSTVGLIAPGGVALDDGGHYNPSAVQLSIYGAYAEYWQAVAERKKALDAECIGVFGGDGTDDNRHSKYQLITPNEATAIKAAKATMEPALAVCDSHYYIRGTEAHAGQSGWMEELVAQMGKATPDDKGNFSHWFCKLEFYGVRAMFAHRPYSNSTRPWTLGGGAMRTAEMIVSDHDERGETPPAFAAFGHYHHYEDSGDTRRTRVFYSDPWCVANAFSHQIGFSGRYQSIGALIFTIMPDGTWKHERFRRWPKDEPYKVVR